MSGRDSCVVIGYASLDFKYHTASFAGPDRTTLIRHPLTAGGPDPGASSYFARELARHQVGTTIVSWVAPDQLGRQFQERLMRDGVAVDGLSETGSRSPSSHLFYAESGELVLFFDPGDLDQSLTTAQRQSIATARAVLVGIGPAAATAEALALIPADALVMWVAKADPASTPADLARRLADRADIICHSESETGFLTEHSGLDLGGLAAQATLVIRTNGARGVICRSAHGDLLVEAPEPVDVIDTTGAGDTFAGALMARLLRHRQPGRDDTIAAVSGACSDAGRMLRSRLPDSRSPIPISDER